LGFLQCNKAGKNAINARNLFLRSAESRFRRRIPATVSALPEFVFHMKNSGRSARNCRLSKNPRIARKGRSPFDLHPHPPALPAGGANEICFRYQFAAVKCGNSLPILQQIDASNERTACCSFIRRLSKIIFRQPEIPGVLPGIDCVEGN